MFDIDWTEILLVAGIALVVIGPKDLPKVLRTIGQWVGKAKALARDFQRSIDDVIQDTGVDEVKKQIESINSYDMNDKVTQAIDPKGELDDAFKIDVSEDDTGKEKKETITATEHDFDSDDYNDFDREPPQEQPKADAGDGNDKQKAGA